MNRIILIGNGFDLAHGLKTRYKDFIDDFWRDEARKIRQYNHRLSGDLQVYKSEFIELEVIEHQYVNSLFRYDLEINSYSDFNNVITKYNRLREKTRAKLRIQPFLAYITKEVSLQNWVDIEDAYHQFLNAIREDKSYEYKSVQELNEDFGKIKNALGEYLIKTVANSVEPIEGMAEEIDSQFDIRDFTAKGSDVIAKAEYTKIAGDFISGESYKAARMYDSSFSYLGESEMLKEIKNDLKDGETASEHFDLSPSQLLFLNFNYTPLEQIYRKENDEIIHIHGELNNTDNPIIFGYGDELGEEYAKLEKLNNNAYLENIKSIKYLETRNYKNLLSFIDSEGYQIFVFGHSCGNSDRTLLNTLFEHENCVSIKVFYHEKDENNITTGEVEKVDDFSDIIRNISRNFNDKKALREKVVNKKDSRPLPQATNK